MNDVIFEVRLDKNVPAFCVDCHIEMMPVTIDIKRKNALIRNIDAFKCIKCGKELIDVETASRIDKEIERSEIKER